MQIQAHHRMAFLMCKPKAESHPTDHLRGPSRHHLKVLLLLGLDARREEAGRWLANDARTGQLPRPVHLLPEPFAALLQPGRQLHGALVYLYQLKVVLTTHSEATIAQKLAILVATALVTAPCTPLRAESAA